MRQQLPSRRRNVTEKFIYTTNGGTDLKVYATFGISRDGTVCEVFGNASKVGTDIKGMISDGCICMSLLLQRGVPIREIARAFGENRKEGEDSGPASSPLGAIARAGAAIERELKG